MPDRSQAFGMPLSKIDMVSSLPQGRWGYFNIAFKFCNCLDKKTSNNICKITPDLYIIQAQKMPDRSQAFGMPNLR